MDFENLISLDWEVSIGIYRTSLYDHSKGIEKCLVVGSSPEKKSCKFW